MTKKHTSKTERSIFLSLISTVLCVAMLAGLTFAWFTMNVESETNVITTAAFDAKVFWKSEYTAPPAASGDALGDGWKNLNGNKPFNEESYLPGDSTIRYFVFYNNSSFPVKFDLTLKNIADDLAGDLNVYKVVDIDSAKELTDMSLIGTLASIKAAGQVIDASETRTSIISTVIGANSKKVVAVGVKLPESYSTIDSITSNFIVKVIATQYNTAVETATATAGEATNFIVYDTPASDDKLTTLSFDDGALESGSTYTLTADTQGLETASSANFTVTGTDATAVGGAVGESTVASIDLKLYKDNTIVDSFESGTAVTIETYIATGLTGVGVAYNGTGAQPTNVTYDPTTGKLTFTTTHFSEYVVFANEKAYIKETNAIYSTLADAISAVSESGTIMMIGDDSVEAGVTVDAGKNITLDLNGHTISGNTDSTKTYALITNKGILTINDSTDKAKDGTGKGLITTFITNPDGNDIPGYASNTITNHGTLTVNSGKIVNNGSGYACYAIDNQTNGTAYTPVLTINGGRMEQMNAYTYAVRMFCNSTTNVNTTIVNGGVITGGYGLWLQSPNENANKASLTVNGGIIDSRDGLALFIGGTKAVRSNTEITINNGEIKGNGLGIQGTLSGTYGKVEINDGHFAGIQCGANVEKFIKGGTFDSEPDAALIADGYSAMPNSDNSYKVVQTITGSGDDLIEGEEN